MSEESDPDMLDNSPKQIKTYNSMSTQQFQHKATQSNTKPHFALLNKKKTAENLKQNHLSVLNKVKIHITLQDGYFGTQCPASFSCPQANPFP